MRRLLGARKDHWTERLDTPWEVNGLWLKVRLGAKGKDFDAPDAAASDSFGDLVMEVWTAGGWQPVQMELVYCLVDFIATNEDWLTQFRRHWKVLGGDAFMGGVQMARKEGWEAAKAGLDSEKQRLKARLRR